MITASIPVTTVALRDLRPKETVPEGQLSTATVFWGSVPMDYIRGRLFQIAYMNPWLLGTLTVSGQGDKPQLLLSYPRFFSKNEALQRVFQYRRTQMGMENRLEELVQGDGIRIHANHLFCLVVVECKEEEKFSLVVSISSAIADANTYYRIYSMLHTDVEPYALKMTRLHCMHDDLLQEMQSGAVLDTFWISIAIAVAGLFHRVLFPNVPKRKTQWCMVSREWLENRPQPVVGTANEEDTLSTLDALTVVDCLASWGFQVSRASMGILELDVRNLCADMDKGGLVAGNKSGPVLVPAWQLHTPVRVREYMNAVWDELELPDAVLPCPKPPMVPPISLLGVADWTVYYQGDLQLDKQGIVRVEVHFVVDAPRLVPKGRAVGYEVVLFCPRVGRVGVWGDTEIVGRMGVGMEQ